MGTNIDIVTPIHDDPVMMGKIAACNATNDLFAINAVDVINFNCFLGLPIDIPEDIAAGLLKGIQMFLQSIDAEITGGHTIQNDAPLMGGSTSAILQKEHIIGKQGVKDGDHLIITKPIGIQTIMAADRTAKQAPSYLSKYDFEKIHKGIQMAEKTMTTSNRPIPKMIHDYNLFDMVSAMTDITGFGFEQHLSEMLVNSNSGAIIEKLPAIFYAKTLEDLFCYGVDEGASSEIAGPMLLSVKDKGFSEVTERMSERKIWWMEVGNISRKNTGVKYTDDFTVKNVEKYW